MSTLDLFNLIPFFQRLPEHAASGQVGPFRIALSPLYDDAVRLVQHPEDAGDETPVPCFRIIAGCWAATAQASPVERNCEQSVLCSSPAADGGTSDLLELLTFLTGRRVAVRDTLERYHPSSSVDAPVHSISVFRAGAEAWPNRAQLVEHKIQLALIFHNCAADYDAIPVKAGMYNTALNILLDNWPGIGAVAIPRPVRENLADLVDQVVATCPDLDVEQRKAYRGLLRAKALQGTGSPHARLVRLLQDLGVVKDPCDAGTERRVRYVNTARNSIAHGGKMPQFKGMDQEQSNLLTVAIVACLVREINQIALGQMLQIQEHIIIGRELQAFFARGEWAGQQLEPAEVAAVEELA